MDVVLNSLSGEALRQSWLLVAPYGHFIELGKRDIVENSGLDMAPFIKNVSFHAVNILVSYRECVPRAAHTLHNSLRFFWDHHCQPSSPVQVMPFSQLPDALRLLRSGTQVGKVVIRAEDEDRVMAVPRPVTPARLSPEATYVIVGGMGGLGQFIAKWMVEQGARHLLFLSRQGAKHPDAAGVLETLNASPGVQAATYECDITDSEQVQRAFSRCRDENRLSEDSCRPQCSSLYVSHPAYIHICIHICKYNLTTQNATFTKMTHSQWTISIRTKALGTWNLHLHTTAQPLDFFIMLSSVSGIIGWRGQTNYAASNTFLDALAHHRRARGLPAASVDLGAVLDVGYIAGRTELRNAVKLQGLLGIGGTELLSILHAAIMGQGQERNTTNTSDSDGIQFISAIATGGWAVSENIEPPYYHSDAKMSHFRLIGAAHPGAAGTQAPKLQLQEKLSIARSLEEASTAVSDALRGRLAQQLSISVEDIDASKPVSAYGVDSLTAVEIRAWSFRDVQADVSVLDVVNTGSTWGLVGIIVRNSWLTPVEILER